VAVAAVRRHLVVVQQTIEDRRRHLIAAGEAFSAGDHLDPVLRRAVGADPHAALLVAAGDQLEGQGPAWGSSGG